MTTTTNSLNSVQTINVLWGIVDDMLYRSDGNFPQLFHNACDAKAACNAVIAQMEDSATNEVKAVLHSAAAKLNGKYRCWILDAKCEFVERNSHMLKAMNIDLDTVRTVLIARVYDYVNDCEQFRNDLKELERECF